MPKEILSLPWGNIRYFWFVISAKAPNRLLLRSHLDHWKDWSGVPRTRRDSHHAMEINFVESGTATYLFAGSVIPVPKGRLILFWGITPHQVIEREKETRHHWMEIPLALFLQWRLTDALVARLFAGDMVMEPDVSWTEHDRVAFHRWHRDLKRGSAKWEKIVALEVEARLRRFALSYSPGRQPSVLHDLPAGKNLAALQKIGRMAAYVARNYSEPLRLEQVAREAGLRADYATTLFKKVSGLSVMDYVTQHRIAHAQRQLLTTDDKVLDIALQAGFGSASRFYEAFSQWCGQCPRQYRALGQKERTASKGA